MKLKQLIAGAVLTGGLGAATLGLGAGLAYADPPRPRPGPVVVEPLRIPRQDRDGYDRARHDHRPFQYQGQWVNPVFDQVRNGWGFWFGPIWIPL